jgi:hypothetical protein
MERQLPNESSEISPVYGWSDVQREFFIRDWNDDLFIAERGHIPGNQAPELAIIFISIFAQVNITNPTSWLVKFDVLSCYIHLQVNITKQKFSKWRLAVLWTLYW